MFAKKIKCRQKNNYLFYNYPIVIFFFIRKCLLNMNVPGTNMYDAREPIFAPLFLSKYATRCAHVQLRLGARSSRYFLFLKSMCRKNNFMDSMIENL